MLIRTLYGAILWLIEMCEHKVNETRKRSVLKVSSSKVIEVIIDTFVIASFPFWGVPAVVTAITIEMICFSNHFIIERLWNKIQWGRQITETKTKIKCRLCGWEFEVENDEKVNRPVGPKICPACGHTA